MLICNAPGQDLMAEPDRVNTILNSYYPDDLENISPEDEYSP